MDGLVRSLPMNNLILLLVFHWPAPIDFATLKVERSWKIKIFWLNTLSSPKDRGAL